MPGFLLFSVNPGEPRRQEIEKEIIRRESVSENIGQVAKALSQAVRDVISHEQVDHDQVRIQRQGFGLHQVQVFRRAGGGDAHVVDRAILERPLANAGEMKMMGHHALAVGIPDRHHHGHIRSGCEGSVVMPSLVAGKAVTDRSRR
ncbi:MAG: hypothetical protein ACYTG7_13325 [Planctomycetota bacterium]